ncbi:dihydrodipicolinate synthase family protein [Pseudohoeflea coraliihabitans]|uniref:Dihydrodipicolinate synthase family protein n=1 Tax=Pseudohoeflea coraliihabitans TaxID=2860393 RepID=A0ABS6WSR0_9HYPH|nr:dihydrodipicolinate synthase family protein [Pseudohoeflea sp. DP4N28-3]MBW3098992.1 dihydrodipicolinate synthase family protein [Pseudohoeflea sp. DP4N28-3]
MHFSSIPSDVRSRFRDGVVIPAQPLALTAARQFDVHRQRALTRYYCDAGAGGLAVGVHTTQFAIRDVGLYRPVLETAAETASDWCSTPLVMIAGVAGKTAQALEEARTARAIGYHAVLLSLAALKGGSEDELIEHCQAVAREMPLVGFYLQPAVGGMPLGASFWQRFAAIENVIGIKVAPFNRYATLDVMAGVAAANAADRVTLYTGNDDHIVLDLVTPFRTEAGELHFAGGLLGHWSVWTQKAVEILERCKAAQAEAAISKDLLALDSAVTDCNAAFFDAGNAFHGVIAGCHEVLRRQGLLEGRWCLDPDEDLSPGQSEAIDRVYRRYPDLNDDAFVQANLSRWLGDA